jgi:Spy/CpxP family protein refolding chaperone
MRKTRIEILLIGLTVVALGAGVVAGVLASRLPAAQEDGAVAPPAPGVEPTPLAQELGLSPDQQAQMRGIWETVRGRVHGSFEEAQRLQKQRDEALVALLNDEQKAKFQRIARDFADRFDKLSHERKTTFDEAVAKTRRLLNDEQRQKYDEILKKRVGPAGERGYGGGGGGEPVQAVGATTRRAD